MHEKNWNDDNPASAAVSAKTCGPVVSASRRRGRQCTRFLVREAALDGIDEHWLAQRESLDERAAESNASLFPHFVLPLFEFITPEADALMRLAELRRDGGREMAGLGVFEETPRSSLLPLLYRRAYRSPYGFLQEVIVDVDCAEGVLDALCGYWFNLGDQWHGVEFSTLRADSRLAVEMRRLTSQHGTTWFPDHGWSRAAGKPAEGEESISANCVTMNRRKQLRNEWRTLEEWGQVEIRLVFCGGGYNECAKTFPYLEAVRWKGARQTALKTDEYPRRFFWCMISGVARSGRAIYSELPIVVPVVASTSNFISGDEAFAIKIGSHPGYANAGSTLLAEFETAGRASRDLDVLEYSGSCAAARSYIEKLWPSKRRITGDVLATSKPEYAAAAPLWHVRKIKRRLWANKGGIQ